MEPRDAHLDPAGEAFGVPKPAPGVRQRTCRREPDAMIARSRAATERIAADGLVAT